jgi:hypothetical protein
MTVPDDYQDEMDALSTEEVDAVVGGRAAREPNAARAGALVADLRRALREEPTPEVARAHVEAMVAAARSQARAQGRFGASTRRRIGGVGLAAVLTLGGTLAAAVTLPPQADDRAREAAWQGTEVAVEASAHGKAVQAVARDSTLEGCEKGQAVAEVASSKARGGPPEERPDPCVQAEDSPNDDGGRGRGKDASAFGKAKAEQAREDGKALGQDTADQAKAGGADFGQQTAGQASGGARGTRAADDAAEFGKTTASEATGGAGGSRGPPAGTPGGPPGS